MGDVCALAGVRHNEPIIKEQKSAIRSSLYLFATTFIRTHGIEHGNTYSNVTPNHLFLSHELRSSHENRLYHRDMFRQHVALRCAIF